MSVAANPRETIDLSSLPVSIADVFAARKRIMGHLHRTPLIASANLSASSGFNVSFKAENLQRTGSFKARGALNALLTLSPEQRDRGVVTFSAGNHGAGIAFAASKLGIQSWIYMASTAVPAKVDAIRGYGANVVFGETMDEAYAEMNRAIEEDGRFFVSPFDDPAVVAGQAIAALEILEDAPDTEAIVVPIGGGGLVSGISLVVKSVRPDITVVGVEPEGACAVSQSLASGQPVRLVSTNTIADGLAAPFTGAITQAIISTCTDRVVLVTDDEIREAMGAIMTRTKLLPEPAGAASFAALSTGKTGIAEGTNVVCLLSGGNVSLDRLKSLL
ncbi:bifunctional threonine ammonia-lyase/L-serine ammonia-lyase TdcB [soil metagenome]